MEKNSHGGHPHAMLGNEEREKGGNGKEGERERERVKEAVFKLGDSRDFCFFPNTIVGIL